MARKSNSGVSHTLISVKHLYITGYSATVRGKLQHITLARSKHFAVHFVSNSTTWLASEEEQRVRTVLMKNLGVSYNDIQFHRP